MRWVRRICVHAWLGFLGFSSSFLGTCLLTFLMTACRATHMCQHMPASHTTHTHLRWGRVCTEGLAGVTCRPHSGHPGSRASAQAGTRVTGGTTRSLEVVSARTRGALDGRCLSSPALTLGVPAARGEGLRVSGADSPVLLL